jgi:hypothetical protein
MRPSTGEDGDAIRRRLHEANIKTPGLGDRQRSNKTVAVAAGTQICRSRQPRSQIQ